MLCCAEKKQERYKKCGSHDDQSWHSNCKWGVETMAKFYNQVEKMACDGGI